MRLVRDTRGSAPLWVAFIAIVLCMLSIVAYTSAMLFSTYRAAQTELERAANISVDRNMENRNVRDLVLYIPQEQAQADLENNLSLLGWTRAADGTWKKFNGERLAYELKGLSVEVHDDILNVSAIFSLPLPWAIGNLAEVVIPITVRCKVFYLD